MANLRYPLPKKQHLDVCVWIELFQVLVGIWALPQGFDPLMWTNKLVWKRSCYLQVCLETSRLPLGYTYRCGKASLCSLFSWGNHGFPHRTVSLPYMIHPNNDLTWSRFRGLWPYMLATPVSLTCRCWDSDLSSYKLPQIAGLMWGNVHMFNAFPNLNHHSVTLCLAGRFTSSPTLT